MAAIAVPAILAFVDKPMSTIFINSPRHGGGPFWTAGGASGALAVYQPKGAASLAASYVNLANPGTYDAAPGVAPTWDAVNGWIFNGSTQYLQLHTSGYGSMLSNGAYTIIVHVASDHVTPTTRQIVIGDWNFAGSGESIAIEQSQISTTLRTNQYDSVAQYISYGVAFSTGVPVTLGVTWGGASIKTRNIFLNGSYVTGDMRNSLANGESAVIGRAGAYNGLYLKGRIVALAIYSATLTAPQVAAVSAAMAAL